MLGMTYLDLMQFEEAKRLLLLARETADRINSRFWQLSIAGYVAMIASESGVEADLRDALARVDPALPMQTLAQRSAWLGAAQARAALGDHEGALAILRRLGDTAANHGGRGILALPVAAWRAGLSLHALGRDEEAAEMLEAAAASYKPGEMLPHEWRINSALGDIYAALGRHEASAAAKARAREIVEHIAARIDDLDHRATFLRHESVARVITQGVGT
jgi:tetratricopeptide (TPR) repeat protein